MEDVVKLDLKDKKLLFELDFDARAPYSTLAKKVGLSKQGVEYKVHNLMRKGVIKGFYPVIDMAKLGYLYCRLLLTFHNVTKERLDAIMRYLQEHKKVFWVLKMQGKYDLFVIMWARSITEFREFIQEIQTEFGAYVKDRVESIATNVLHYQHKYLLRGKEGSVFDMCERTDTASIDALDMDVLRQLADDARMPIVEIAKRLRESPNVISYRMRKLERQGVIACYRTIVDHNTFGYTYYKIFITLNNASADDHRKIRAYIDRNPLLVYRLEAIGLTCDLDVELMVGSNQELFDFIEDLRFKFPKLVGDYHSAVFLDTLKIKYLPF